MTIGTVDSGLDCTLALNARCRNLTSITNKLICLFFSNGEVNLFYTRFVRVGQRIFWKNFCFRRFVRHHGWLSGADFNNLRYRSQGFLVRKLLAVNHLTVGTVDSGLDRPFALDTRSCDLTSIANQFIGILLIDGESNLLNARFIGVSQRILWQSICFRCFIWYHGWFSCADLDDLCYGRQGFLIRQLLAVNLLTVRTVDTSLDRALSLNTWCCDLATTLWNLICILLVNRKINLFYSNLIICSQF